MERGVTSFFGQFQDWPEQLSGWGHNYFCERDGGRLIYNQTTPDAHKCPVCNHVYTGSKYANAWVYINRVHSFQHMQKAAYLYAETKDSKYLTYVTELLDYYADNYHSFVLHEKDNLSPVLTQGVPGAGKITPQGLNEAQVLVKILLTLDLLKDLGAVNNDYLLGIKEKIFVPAIDILTPQINRVHNIKAWIDAAIGMAGIFYDEPQWLATAFEGEYNIYRQLREGVTADKFWYEGSIHYHYFMLEGTVSLLYFCKKYGVAFEDPADPVTASLPKAMLLEAYNYAFDNGIFPNPNDGWPDINLKTYLQIYYLASYVYSEDDQLAQIIARINAMPIERITLPLWDPYCYEGIALEALMFPVADLGQGVTTEHKPSVVYPASNFAILRNERVNVFVKYGHNGPSHAHPDKMTFELTLDNELVSRDLSNAGYGAEICDQWHRVSASHNTVVVDGQNHTNVEGGQVVSFDAKHIAASATAAPGIELERRFELVSSGVVDKLSVTGTGEHTFDNFIHIDGTITHPSKGQLAEIGFDTNGYEHIKNIYETPDRQFELSVKNTKLSLKLDDDAQVFVCETLDNPVTQYRQALIVRKKGALATFNAVYTYS